MVIRYAPLNTVCRTDWLPKKRCFYRETSSLGCKDDDAAVLELSGQGHNCSHIGALGICNFKMFAQMCGCTCAGADSKPTRSRPRRMQAGPQIGFADTKKCMLQNFNFEISRLNSACCSAADGDDKCVHGVCRRRSSTAPEGPPNLDIENAIDVLFQKINAYDLHSKSNVTWCRCRSIATMSVPWSTPRCSRGAEVCCSR